MNDDAAASSDPQLEQLASALGGRYTLIRELGRGGMGAVYLGQDAKLGREVAIKVLLPDTRAVLGDERFQREVRLVSQLSHPNIVPLFEADAAGEYEFYVMQYVAGESLQQRLTREGSLPVEDALRITREVADALHYAHQRGIVHRDIKPANILLSGGHALVADFGIAKRFAAADEASTLTGTGVAIGTASYMSPEQASGERRVDARSDVYALAAVLYEMLAGEPPFTGPTAQAIVARILVDAPRSIRTIRPAIPLAIERALEAALAKVAADRPATAQAFVDLLSRPAPSPKPLHRGWLVGGVLAAAIGIGVVALLSRGGHPAAPAGMVLVHAGRYPVGGSPWRDPTHVQLAAFFIDSTEVTAGDYTIADRGARSPYRIRPPADWPVTGVLWEEAQAFCASRLPGGRLPSENEWEAAARGPQGRRFPWGDKWAPGRANVASATDTIAPVGSFPLGASWVHAMDMVGNAWEWTASAAPGPNGEGLRHIVKGGAFNTLQANAAAAYRVALPEDRRQLWNTGFRCARSLTP